LIVLGVIALTAPLATGRWSLAFLGICLIVLGLVEAYAAFTSPKRAQASAYLPSVLAIFAGNVLLLSASLVLSGLLVLLIVTLVIDGVGKILTGLRSAQTPRLPSLVNGLLDFAGAALLWYLNRQIGTGRAIGIIIGVLSIGTALDFPKQPATSDWAFYPSTDRVRAKLDDETPLWKQPFWYWIKWFKAWPFSTEALSGMFDFNRAPFFLSFVEVRIERSKRRVVLVLNGIRGPLQWADLQIGGAVVPAGSMPSAPVEFIVPMDGE
jgi:uncharacterized membrane protein HdeD (DUF308 family)